MYKRKVVLVVSACAVVVVSYVRQRARRVKETLLIEESILLTRDGGTMINESDTSRCESMLGIAIQRATTLLGNQHPIIMSCQVGGISPKKSPMLQLLPYYVLKPMQTGNRGIREVAFYESIKVASDRLKSESEVQTDLKNWKTLKTLVEWITKQLSLDNLITASEKLGHKQKAEDREVHILASLAQFTPAYYGVVQYSPSQDHSTSKYIVLQDLTYNYSKPCVMDIKMGTRTYEPDAPTNKIRREEAKYPSQVDFGFRIVDMILYDDNDGWTRFGKSMGRSLLTRASVLATLRLFFSKNRNANRIMNLVLTKLNALAMWFDSNDQFSFYASSLLLVYDANNADVRMIDFGHVRRSCCGDDGYKVGLSTFIELMKELLIETTSQ